MAQTEKDTSKLRKCLTSAKDDSTQLMYGDWRQKESGLEENNRNNWSSC